MMATKKKQAFSTVFSLDETAAAQSALDKVFPEQSVEQAALQVVQGVDRTSMLVPVASIVPNPYQPRKRFQQAKLQKLAESIKKEGELQPHLVRPPPPKQG